MSDFKSKMPDFNEISNMATKLFKDVKTSVSEIVDMYKEKRAHESTEVPTSCETKSAEKKAESEVSSKKE